MGASDIAEAYMKFFDSSLSAALEGLDNSTIIDPQRRKVPETVYALIPAGHNVARVAAARTGLQRLICISSDMQETRKTVTLKSQEQEAAVVGADKDHALLADALKATNEKLSSMERQHDEKVKHLEALNAQVEEATNALHKIKKGVKELKSKQSNQQAEAKKLRDTLSEVNTRTSQELEALQKNMSTMGDEVGSIVESMKKSLPPSC
jgi:chromosome segregation ATPase